MALKEKLVQGAICQCKFGSLPDKLKVLTQTKYYLNDHEGKSKLAATHKDIGATFENGTFGPCQMQPTTFGYKPCQSVITAWSGYYEKEMYTPPGGYILLEDSKATCPIGGTDCISVIMSGQIAEPSQKNFESADSELQAHINPVIEMKEYYLSDPYEFLNVE